MRIRVVGRKSGVTDKDVGAAVSVAVGAIKAGRHKGVIKGKCLWVYNPYLDIATIKLMLINTSLVVKLDIDEYKYTDIEAVLDAAANLYKDDAVSQFTSSAMYKNIKAISEARFLEYLDKDAITNIFMATCEVASAEATIPQSASDTKRYTVNGENIQYDAENDASNTEFRGRCYTLQDIRGLRTSLTRFAWFVNSAINNADVAVIQDVYTNMEHSLSEAASMDWTDSYTAAINRVLAAISALKYSVPSYFTMLQTTYGTVPTANISAYARELRAAILAMPSGIDIGVSEDDLSRMYGVIAIATVVEACAEYVNKGVETYNSAYAVFDKPFDSYFESEECWLVCDKGAIDFSAAFGQECPTTAVTTVVGTSIVYADGDVAVRIHAVPVVEYIIRYANIIEGSEITTNTSYDDTPPCDGRYCTVAYGGTNDYSGQASVTVNSMVPCALLVGISGAYISEELRVNGFSYTTEHSTAASDVSGSRTYNGATGGDIDGYSSGTGGSTYTRSVAGSGICTTVVGTPCNGIYAYGTGFSVTTAIQWSIHERIETPSKGDKEYEFGYGYDTSTDTMDDHVNTTMDTTTTPTYNAYSPLFGSVCITDPVQVVTTVHFGHEFTYVSDGEEDFSLNTGTGETRNTATFSVNTSVGGGLVGSGTLRSHMEVDIQYGTSGDPTRTRDDTVQSMANRAAVAEYYPENVYDTLLYAVSLYKGTAPLMPRYDPSLTGYIDARGGAIPRYIGLGYTRDMAQIYNIDYGVRYGLGVDAQRVQHTGSCTTTAKYKDTWSTHFSHISSDVSQEANTSATFETVRGTEPMFTDGEYGPVTSTLSGKVAIIDVSGGVVYSAHVVDVISAAVCNGYIMRAVDYAQLFIPEPEHNILVVSVPIINPPDIPLVIGSGFANPAGVLTVLGGNTFISDIKAPNATDPCGTYTKIVNPSTYTVDNAPEPIRNYNKLLRCPEFLVLNSLMGEEYTDTSVTPPVTKHVPSFVPLDTAIQYMSMDGEGTPTPKLNVGQIQPIFVYDQSKIDQVKDRVNEHIAAKIQELANKYLQDNPTAVVDEAVYRRFTPTAVKSAIEEQLFTPIRDILPAHTEVTTAAVKPVGASTSSNAEPMGIEYVLSVVSRGIGTYVDLGVLV